MKSHTEVGGNKVQKLCYCTFIYFQVPVLKVNSLLYFPTMYLNEPSVPSQPYIAKTFELLWFHVYKYFQCNVFSNRDGFVPH